MFENDGQSTELDSDKSNETVTNKVSSPKLPEIKEIKEIKETKEIKEAKEDVVTDKPDNQDANIMVPDSAKRENSPRNATPEDQFEFDPETGTITGYTGTSTEVVIPSTIKSVPVTKIGNLAFNFRQLTGVTIPNSVVSIGEWAFHDNELTEIEIPNSMKIIGAQAFR